MTENGLVPARAIAQCLAAIIDDPSLLDEYSLDKNDFAKPFYSLIFSAVNNLYNSGVSIVDACVIDNYLSNYQKQYDIFNKNKGLDYIVDILDLYEKDNFSYYLAQLKKFSCLRYWNAKGFDTTKIYDPDITDPELQTQEMLKLDNMTVNEMIDRVHDVLINEAQMMFSTSTNHIGQLAGKGLRELVDYFEQEPDFGLPLQSEIVSTITRGARLTKLYLRSGSSGSGKTRLGIADCCNFSVPYYYDTEKNDWTFTGFSEPTLIISTELEINEVQTLIMAYVSGVNESHILEGEYEEGERDRVIQATDYINSSPLYIEFIPDFGITEIEQLIRKYQREKGVRYFFFDYIHMSNKLITEVAMNTNGMRLREDQILFLFADQLKNLCNKLNVFILSSTQLNGTYKDSAEKDETMLRGAKSLADRIDMGEISLPPSAAELDAAQSVMSQRINTPVPNLIRHVYKLRRGKWSKIKIYQSVDLGTCRTRDLFVFDRNNNLIDIPAVQIRTNVAKAQKMTDETKAVEKVISENSVDIHQMPEDLKIHNQTDEITIATPTEEQIAVNKAQAEAKKQEVEPKHVTFDW